jgi:hypothetical protein
MIKMLFVFFIASLFIHLVIMFWRELTNKEKWSTIKTLAYSLGISALAVGLLCLIVIIF